MEYQQNHSSWYVIMNLNYYLVLHNSRYYTTEIINIYNTI